MIRVLTNVIVENKFKVYMKCKRPVTFTRLIYINEETNHAQLTGRSQFTFVLELSSKLCVFAGQRASTMESL